jgi:hypothetical protein
MRSSGRISARPSRRQTLSNVVKKQKLSRCLAPVIRADGHAPKPWDANRILSSPLFLFRCLTWAVALLGTVGNVFPQSVSLTDAQAERIGRKLWQNESGGTIAGLTAWNSGEDFASLGIGHFIWYPVNMRGPFEESFPPLIRYLVSSGVRIPPWLEQASGCPWSNRVQFIEDQQSPRMKELRSLLADTISFQAKFAGLRLESALPKMLEAVPSEDREKIRANFNRVAGEPRGLYALVDYVNFKGEGTLATERYHGEGWGLLQVLEEMRSGPSRLEFSRAADRVLTRRVANAPVARDEKRWLPGWRNRIRTYAQ